MPLRPRALLACAFLAGCAQPPLVASKTSVEAFVGDVARQVDLFEGWVATRGKPIGVCLESIDFALVTKGIDTASGSLALAAPIPVLPTFGGSTARENRTNFEFTYVPDYTKVASNRAQNLKDLREDSKLKPDPNGPNQLATALLSLRNALSGAFPDPKYGPGLKAKSLKSAFSFEVTQISENKLKILLSSAEIGLGSKNEQTASNAATVNFSAENYAGGVCRPPKGSGGGAEAAAATSPAFDGASMLRLLRLPAPLY